MKKSKLALTLAFLLLVGGVSLGSIIVPDKKFSENENRYLADFPKFSWDNFIEGRFQSELEEYLKDHIIFRDQWSAGKTALTIAAGGHEVNGAYLGKDGYLFEKLTEEEVDQKNFEGNLKAVKEYFDDISESVDSDCISFLLVPTSGYVMSNELPAFAPLFDQSSYIDQAKEYFMDYNFIDVRDVLKANNEEEIYYRTDHHWTTLGAYYGYSKWCQRTNHVCLGKNSFMIEEENDQFRGSLYSKVLNANCPYDTVVSYTRLDEHQYMVKKDGEECDSFYAKEMLEKKDKYAFFFGGNYAEVAIERLATEDINAAERNLLVIKDSFANCFVPFITAEFDNVYMIDLRYYTGDMKRYIKEHEITDVLVLYNISNFVSDRNMKKLGISLPVQDKPVEKPSDKPSDKPAASYEEITTSLTPLVKGNLIVLGDRAFEFYAYKEDMAKKYAQGINDLAEKLKGKAKVYDLLIPLSSGITFPDKYWDKYDIQAQPQTIEAMTELLNKDVTLVNIYDVMMKHRKEYLYFRTDHHWTALGAYYAYTEFCKEKAVEPVPLESYTSVDYNGFLGSLYREYKNEAMKNNPDTITAYLPISDSEMTLTDIYGKVTTEGILADGDTIPTSDKYCVFIHGDYPYSDVHNKDLHDGSSCIVVKESFGNAFVPYLIEHYEHVYVVDYRYWNGNLADLVDKTGAKEVLFVNNLYAIRNQYLLSKILEAIY